MKCITLTQPWASLVAIGAKQIETRSWSTRYRGPLAIHAAAGGYVDDYIEMKIEPFYSALVAGGIPNRLYLPLGGVLAICDLVDCFRFDGDTWKMLHPREVAFGDFRAGRFGFRLINVRRLPEPIPARGALGLWTWDPPAGVKL